MQFYSVPTGNYLAGAQSVVENVNNIYDTAVQTGFKVDQVIKQSNANDAVKKAASARRNASVAKQATQTFADLKESDIYAKAEEKASEIMRPAKRMAGVAAATTSFSQGYLQMQENKLRQQERAQQKAEQQKLYDALIAKHEQETEESKTQQELNEQELEELRGKLSSLSSKSDDAPPTPAEVPAVSTNTSQPLSNTSQPLSNTSQPLSNTSQPIMSKGWQKLSTVLRTGEGTLGDKGYTTMFGGGQFTDTSKHPNKLISKSGYNSSAAGAYQFLTPTWNDTAKALGLSDFSPESQEKGARHLTKKRGVDPDNVITDFQTFKNTLDKLAPEWASMPYQGVNSEGFGRGGSYYGQPSKSAESLWKIYQQS